MVDELFEIFDRLRNCRCGVIGIEDDIDIVVLVDIFEGIRTDRTDVDTIDNDCSDMPACIRDEPEDLSAAGFNIDVAVG